MAFEITREQITKQANELLKLFQQTRIQKYKDEEIRLRRIVVELEAFTGGSGGTPNLDQVTTAGNTTSNTIDVGGITTDYVTLDTAATPTPVVGMMSWDTDRSTVSVQLDSDVDAHLGQDNFWYVKNQSGSTIPKGKAVMAVGTLGASGRILIDEMVANGSVSAKYLLGVTAEDIANGADGFVINIGKLRQIDTSMYSAGAVLYCDPSSPGNFTTTLPSAPNLKLPIAFVVHSAANGTLAIRVNIGSDLYEDHRVQVNTGSLADGQLLRYDSTDQRWENWTPNFLTSVPTLAQVTTAGNTTTNPISVSKLTVNALSDAYESAKFKSFADTYHNLISFYLADNTTSTVVLGRNGASVAYPYKTGTLASYGFVGNNYSGFHIFAGSNIAQTIHTNGNIGINTTTDAGYKLDVNGTTRLNGLTSINSTTVANTALAIAANGTGAGNFIIQGYDSSANNRFYITASGNFRINGQTDTGASGSDEKFRLNLSFAPTSGTREHLGLWLQQTINQTGGANGITRGIYINPTLTSAADFRAIHTTAGKVIHQGLTAATQTNQVYYNTTTGELTYGALPTVATPTLDQVTTAGNTTTNAITVGDLTVATNLIVTDAVNGRINFGGTTTSDSAVSFRFTKNSTTQARLGVYGSNKLGVYLGLVDNNAAIYAYNYTAGAAVPLILNGFGGNVLINTTTDAGYKLDVNGSARSNALYVQNGIGTYGAMIGTTSRYAYTALTVATPAGSLSSGTVAHFEQSRSETTYLGDYDKPTITLANVDTTVDSWTTIQFSKRSDTASATAGIGVQYRSSQNSDMAFFTRGSNTFSEKMRITSGGNVLIGTTTNAGYKLDVNGDVRVQRVYSNIIRDSNGNNIISTNVINISNTDTQIGTGTTNTITLNTKSSGGVYIPAGNVGIGTITPTYKLQVNGTVSAQLTNATHTSQVYYNTTTGELTYGALPTVATPTLAQVTTAGNTTTNAVTVGGLTVTGMIEVFKVGSSVEFRSLDSNINFLGKSDNTGGVNFYGGGAYNTGGGISVTGNSNLNPSSIYFFRDAFTQNGRFFSSGNLLLGSGSTDAGYKLDVSGTIRSSGVITASGGTSTDWNAAYSWGNHATAGYLTGTTGYTGIFTVPTNPPGQQNLDIVNGLIVNVF